ncbi:MAG: alpha/beta fold hydrolase BchO [Pseudomonadota bacterium]
MTVVAHPMRGATSERIAQHEHVSAKRIKQVDTQRVGWSVAQSGRGPGLLFLHGTGAAKHSWRTLAPLIDHRFTVFAPDLPGHGDSEIFDPSVMSLAEMARETGALIDALNVSPQVIVGHSAGAALAMRLVLDGYAAPSAIVSINGAFMVFGGVINSVLAPLAGLCSGSRLVTHALARKARDLNAVKRVIASTGSKLDDDSIARYRAVLQKPAHLEATFAMMANWDLGTLRHDMRRNSIPLHLLVATQDGAVEPRQGAIVARECPHATLQYLPGLGHVAHEEAPEQVAQYVLQMAQQWGG